MLRKLQLAIVLLLLIVTASAHAQSVSRPTFIVLQNVQELMDVEQYSEALVLLEALALKTVDNPYDFALTNQYLAHNSVMLENTARARTALEAALAQPELPDDLRGDMNLFYGTVLLSDEDYELAVAALAEWYSLAKLPTATQIFSYAYATYMSGDVPGAEPLVVRAVSAMQDAPENWYQLYYRVLFEQKKYAPAEALLKNMISRSPMNEIYWRMLASHNLQLEASGEGLAALMIAYCNELLESDSDLNQIVSLWGYIEAPEKGARLLESWMADKRLESSAENLKHLGNLWLMARERGNALEVLTKVAQMSPDGRTYELLGGLYFEDEKWVDAYHAYANAVRIGDLEEPLRTSLLVGISAFRAGEFDAARKALEAATESDEFRSQAESVLRQMD